MFKTISKYGLEIVLWAGVATFAAMVALPAYAFNGEDVSHCGVNESRMNPTALSDYQECWLDVYSMDKDYGVMGSLFWVRANGEYYSTQLSNLRTVAAREAWLGSIQADVIVEFEAQVEIAEGINEVAILRAELAMMTEERDDLIADLADANDDIATKAVKIMDLNTAIDGHLSTIADRNATIDGYLAQIAEEGHETLADLITAKNDLIKERKDMIETLNKDLAQVTKIKNRLLEDINGYKGIIADLEASYDALGAKYNEVKTALGLTVDHTTADMISKIKGLSGNSDAYMKLKSMLGLPVTASKNQTYDALEDLQADLVSANNQVVSLNKMIADKNTEIAGLKSQRNAVIEAFKLDYTLTESFGSMDLTAAMMTANTNAQNKVLAEAVKDTSVFAGSANINTALKAYEAMKAVSNVAGDFTVDAPVTTGYIGSVPNDTYDIEIVIGGDDETLVFGHDFAEGVMTKLSEADILADIGAAVEAAYDDGFDDGYKAGYVDGFKDGVDSVHAAN